MSNARAPRIPESPAEAEARVARVMADCEAIRAAGGVVHGCDFGVESSMNVAEARAIAAAGSAAARARFPGVLVGEVEDREDRMDAAYDAVRARRARDGDVG